MSLIKLINFRTVEQPKSNQSTWVKDGYFTTAESVITDSSYETIDLAGQLILPGLIETHIHLDKACILERCSLHRGTLEEAIQETAAAKQNFNEEDIYQRGRSVLEKAITQGTTHMRTHVEIDPVIGLKSFHAIQQLQHDFSKLITIDICVFPQEGMLNNPGTEALLIRALTEGADVLGGCPYTDADPQGQIQRLFDLAKEYDRDLDFHLDFDLHPEKSLLPTVIKESQRIGWAGRVAVGHVTSLSALPEEALDTMAKQLASAGIAVTALPSTDLFLTGRDHDHLVPRGVAPLHRLAPSGVCCSISSNNIGNPFTPFGDASLIRQANLFANIAQLGTTEAFLQCLGWVSTESAKLLRLQDHGINVGCKADFICFDVNNPADIITGIQAPSRGFKGGKETFSRPSVEWKIDLPEERK